MISHAFENDDKNIMVTVWDSKSGFSITLTMNRIEAETLSEDIDKALLNRKPTPILEEPIGVVNEDMAAYDHWTETAKLENRCIKHATILDSTDECETCQREKNGDYWSV